MNRRTSRTGDRLARGLPDVVDVNSLGGSSKNSRSWSSRACCENTTSPPCVPRGRTEQCQRRRKHSGKNAERFIVAGVGLIKTLADIRQIVVKEGGTPVYVRDVAEVRGVGTPSATVQP